jgi:hypothetical protein
MDLAATAVCTLCNDGLRPKSSVHSGRDWFYMPGEYLSRARYRDDCAGCDLLVSAVRNFFPDDILSFSHTIDYISWNLYESGETLNVAVTPLYGSQFKMHLYNTSGA